MKHYRIFLYFIVAVSVLLHIGEVRCSGEIKNDVSYASDGYFSREFWKTGLEFVYDDFWGRTAAVIKCRYEDRWNNEFTYCTPATVVDESATGLYNPVIELETDKGTFKSKNRNIIIVVELVDINCNIIRQLSVPAKTRSDRSDECRITDPDTVKEIWDWITADRNNSLVITAERNYPYSDFRMIVNSN